MIGDKPVLFLELSPGAVNPPINDVKVVSIRRHLNSLRIPAPFLLPLLLGSLQEADLATLDLHEFFCGKLGWGDCFAGHALLFLSGL